MGAHDKADSGRRPARRRSKSQSSSRTPLPESTLPGTPALCREGIKLQVALINSPMHVKGYAAPKPEQASLLIEQAEASGEALEDQLLFILGSLRFLGCAIVNPSSATLYKLPIPAEMLERLENETVETKVTLAYFIELNSGFSANVDPQRYQSFGLRSTSKGGTSWSHGSSGA